MRTIENTLGLWAHGLLSSDAVVAWASAAVMREAEPSQALFEPVTYGPEACVKRSQHDFAPRPARLGFNELFSVRALATELASDASVLQFADWASRACMGGDMIDPMVALGYRLDHLLVDCEDPEAARALVRSDLPALLPRCRALAAPLFSADDPYPGRG